MRHESFATLENLIFVPLKAQSKVTNHILPASGLPVQGFRFHLRSNCCLAMVVIALALCMKALLPSGYMPSVGTHIITVSICADASGGAKFRQITIPGKADPSDTQQAKQGSCAFAGHAASGLGGADQAILALGLAFILAVAFAPVTRSPARPFSGMLPPLRGPPAVG